MSVMIRQPQRKNREKWLSFVIFGTTSALLISYFIATGNVDEYYTDTTQKNTTDVCYRKKRVWAFPGLLTTGWTLYGIILGTIVDRLSLIDEERHHLLQRYGGSKKKMLKTCLISEILWDSVVTLLIMNTILVVVLIIVTGKPWFELSYLVYVLSGIGVGPLIMHLLHLSTQSKVYISRILEAQQMYPGHTLAWSYYFNRLQPELETFNTAIRNNRNPFGPRQIKLSLNKLLLLIPIDYYTDHIDKLIKLDKNIETINSSKNTFPVYRLKVNKQDQRCYAMQYVKEPINALKRMSESRVKSVTHENWKDQAKLFYQTLSEILKDPPTSDDTKGTTFLVPIIVKNAEESLKNGGLMKLIMNTVEPPDTCV